jgi:exodeoxyribonuclease VII large subunit
MTEAWSVSTLTRYIRTTLETDYRLKDLSVTGEISNLSRPASGHLYFTLKDANASLRCVMWKGQIAQQLYRPRDGDRVEVHGAVGVYEASGQYQLYTDSIRAAGEGDLFRQFTELKAKLELEGLFEPARKRPLPPQPRRLCVVTSLTAAALRDILHVIRRRCPTLEVIICPTPVQGVEAPPKIVEALTQANQLKPDVIIIARGGGSIEDLWAFNDEAVVRAVAASAIPTISGVGHETAAEMATPDQSELLFTVNQLSQHLQSLISNYLSESRWRLNEQVAILRGLSPRAQLANANQRLDELQMRMNLILNHRLALEQQHVTSLTQRLQSLSPLAILERGYAIVTREGTSEVIRDPNEVQHGEKVEVRVGRGKFKVVVD